MKRRLVSILLVLALILTSGDFTAFAAERQTDVVESVGEEGTVKETCLVGEEETIEWGVTEGNETENNKLENDDAEEKEITNTEIDKENSESAEKSVEQSDLQETSLINEAEVNETESYGEKVTEQVTETAEENIDLSSGVMASGKCGNNLTWELTNDGTLTIFGTGEMWNYEYNVQKSSSSAPWTEYRESLETVIIRNGVTSIGNYAFYCGDFKGDLIIPNGVISIGDYAFCSGTGFKGSLVIPDSVTSIGDYAFQSCNSLTSLMLSNNLISIGENAFCFCSNIKGNLILPDSITNIGNDAFHSCGFTGSLTIPDKVISIGDGAFSSCSFTGSLTIPKSVISIGNSAFRQSYFTGDLTIPNGVKSIGDEAFYMCRFTGNLLISDSVESIGSESFKFCDFENIIFRGNAPRLEYACFDGLEKKILYYPLFKDGWKSAIENLKERDYSNIITCIGYSMGEEPWAKRVREFSAGDYVTLTGVLIERTYGTVVKFDSPYLFHGQEGAYEVEEVGLTGYDSSIKYDDLLGKNVQVSGEAMEAHTQYHYASVMIVDGWKTLKLFKSSGSYKNIKWNIDNNGKLTVEGTGDFSDSNDECRAPWFDSKDFIKFAVINVKGMTDASYMFYDCNNLVSIDFTNFDTSNVTNMHAMFNSCDCLTELDVRNFNTCNVTDMGSMFEACFDIKNLNLSNFDTSNVIDMSSMFGYCLKLKSLDVSKFDTSNVIDMSDMFEYTNLTYLDINNFDTSNVTDMSGMFRGGSFKSLDIGKFDTSNVTNMNMMFEFCEYLTDLNLYNFDTQNVTNMSFMFYFCSNLSNLDISNFDTSNVTGMAAMFAGCNNLVNLDLGSFNTCNVICMNMMFYECSNLTELDLSGFNTAKVETICDMFNGCSKLLKLDLSNFDLSNLINEEQVIGNCSSLTIINSPFNLSQSIKLPTAQASDVWYLSDGTKVTELPRNLSYSVVVGKNAIPASDVDSLTCTGGNINGKGYSYGRVRLVHKGEVIRGKKVKWEFQGYADTFEDKTDSEGYFSLKSPLLTYNKNGSDIFELIANVSYFDDNTWVNVLDFYTMKVTVEPMSYSQNWQLKAKANFEAGIGSNIGAEIGPAKAEASMAEVKVAASGGGAINIAHDYEDGKRNLSLKQTLSTEVAAKTSVGPTANLDFGKAKAEITVVGVNGKIATGGNVTYGITIKDYDPNNMNHLMQVGKFIATSQMYNSGNVLLVKLLAESGFDKYSVKGAGINSSLSGGASVAEVKVSNASNNKAYFSGNVASVNYARTYSAGYEDDSYNNTVKNKLGISSDIKGGILNFDLKKDKIGSLSLKNFGNNMEKNVDFNVTKALDGKINKINYTDKTYTSWGVPFYSNTNSNEISFTTKDEKVLQKLGNRSNIQKFLDSTNAMFFTETFVNETWKDICECANSIDYIVTKKEESTVEVPISLGLSAGVNVKVGVDLAGSSGNSYEKYKGVADNDSLKVTAETSYSSADIDNVDIKLEELLAEPIVAIGNQLSNWLDETVGKIKDGVQAGAAWVGEKFNNMKNWIVHITHPKQDNSRIASNEVQSFAINTYMSSSPVAFEVSGVSMTIGDPYIIYVTDESGNEVADYSNNPLVLKLSYSDTDLLSAGVTSDNVSALAVYMYSEEKCGYIYMGGDVDTKNQEVSIDITKPGQYILAVDSLEPTISNIYLSDTGSTPTIKAVFNELSGFSKFSMKIDDVEYVNEITLDKYMDRSSGSFVYKVEQELTDGAHILAFTATDNRGNATKQPILFNFEVNPKSEEEKVALPTSNIVSGSKVKLGTKIKLTSDKGAKIYYTLNGTKPTVSSNLFTKHIVITQHTVIKAFAVKEGFKDSDIATFIYDITTSDNPDDIGDVLLGDIPQTGIPSGLWIAGVNDVTYTGKAIKPSVRVYDHKTKLTEKHDYTVSYKNNVNANIASDESKAPSVIIKAKGNYSGKEMATFKILPIDINATGFVTTDIAVNPNQKVQKPIPIVTYNGKKLSNKKDFMVAFPDKSANAYKEKGNYPIKIIGQGNYTGEKTINLLITDNPLMTKAKVSKISSQQYTGKALTPTVQVKYGKTVLKQGTDYELTYQNNVKIGTAYAIIKGKGGYSGQKAVPFQITGIAINKATVTGLDTPTAFNGTAITKNISLVMTVNGSPKTLKAGQDYTVIYQNNKNAGTATVILTGINSYSGTLKKTFKINPYDLQTDTDKKISYNKKLSVPYAKNGSCPEPEIYFNKTKLKKDRDYSLSYKNNEAVNSGISPDTAPVVVVKGKGNFKGTLSISFAITSQDMSKLILTASDKEYKNRANIFATNITVTDTNGKTLSAGQDYDKGSIVYTYANAVKLENGISKKAGAVVEKTDIIPVGTKIQVSVTAKAGGYYTGTAKGIYRIIKSDIKKAKVSIPVQTYTGEAIVPKKSDIMVTVGGTKLTESEFEIVGCTNNVKKGNATITLKGKGNYGGTKTVRFKIQSKGFLWWWRK